MVDAAALPACCLLKIEKFELVAICCFLIGQKPTDKQKDGEKSSIGVSKNVRGLRKLETRSARILPLITSAEHEIQLTSKQPTAKCGRGGGGQTKNNIAGT